MLQTKHLAAQRICVTLADPVTAPKSPGGHSISAAGEAAQTANPQGCGHDSTSPTGPIVGGRRHGTICPVSTPAAKPPDDAVGAGAPCGALDGPGKPLLLLDVDGPLNPWLLPPLVATAKGYGTHHIYVDGDRYRVYLHPAHGVALLALSQVVDLVWATTWGRSANTLISPHLGLPTNLPVIAWPDGAQDEPAGRMSWKTRHVLATVGSRAFAWFDDEVNRYDRAYVAGTEHAGPALLRRVAPHVGLVDADFEAVAAWAGAL